MIMIRGKEHRSLREKGKEYKTQKGRECNAGVTRQQETIIARDTIIPKKILLDFII